MKSRYVELLAPAANLSVARAAIDAGADAVYIGGPAFGARAAAGNSMDDIEQLCAYAHPFGARVFLTVNTLLEAQELPIAEQIAWQAYHIGVDALIIQDFELLNCNLPPIPLHASTQCFNFDVDKVLALQDAGFERVVLERALSINEIIDIGAKSDVELEVFIHGAICVGYSGRCTLSEHLTGRSGNRGQCAQPCRSLYDLVDSKGRVIVKNQPLLSPRDLNLSARIAELIGAGVCSLKIEGRLKDEAYVVGVVAHYNDILNKLGVVRPSYGRTIKEFTPDPALNFNRGFTEWFFDGPEPGVGVMGTLPGKIIGCVKNVGDKFFTLDTPHNLNNGDGIAFFDANHRTTGVRVNRVEGENIFPLTMDGIVVGRQISKTSSIQLKPSSRRVIDIDVIMGAATITASDNYGFTASVPLPADLSSATNIEKSVANITASLSKTGNTIFNVTSVQINTPNPPFIPTAIINALRRELFNALTMSRVARPDKITTLPSFIPDKVDYLLRSRFCILREQGMCLKTKPDIALPLHIVNNGRKIYIEFNCATCEMCLTIDLKKNITFVKNN